MVLAMHQIQVACVVRHLDGSAWFEDYLLELAADQRLIASVTSEVGTGGDLRRSVAALAPAGDGGYRFEKQAPTVSYGGHADDLLVTLRRTPDTHEADQVLALARSSQTTLVPLGGWDPLGMRGTCSPPFTVQAAIAAEQVLPAPFSRIAAESMVPISHILWSQVWTGIAGDAFDRARAFVRDGAKRRPDASGVTAQRLAQLASEYSLLSAAVDAGLAEFVRTGDDDTCREELSSVHAALRFNNLKVAASEQAPRVCHGALAVCGIAGYRNDTPYSVGRHLRDTLSACIMVANDRILQTNAAILLVAKET
jgi:acyl-CoA dehydrogenase